jgi:ATP-dependent protease HslVU (ClpYQ) peptidase subunit
MTVVVAARTKNDGIVMASDSELVGGWQKGLNAVPKIWVVEERLMGSAGSVRAAQVMRHMVEWPDLWVDMEGGFTPDDIERFMVKSVWPAMRYAADSNGVLQAHRGQERIEADFLIAYGDTLVEIASDGSIVIPPSGRAAIGSGYAEALGHLGDDGPWSRAQVVKAARKARLTAVGVGGPIYVASTASLTVELEPE